MDSGTCLPIFMALTLNLLTLLPFWSVVMSMSIEAISSVVAVLSNNACN